MHHSRTVENQHYVKRTEGQQEDKWIFFLKTHNKQHCLSFMYTLSHSTLFLIFFIVTVLVFDHSFGLRAHLISPLCLGLHV